MNVVQRHKVILFELEKEGHIKVNAFSDRLGLTTSNIGEARLNQAMMQAAQKVIVLTDSSKFGKLGFGKICNLNQVHKIITDSNDPANTVQMIREKGIEATLV